MADAKPKGKKKLPKWALPAGFALVAAAAIYFLFIRKGTGGSNAGTPYPSSPTSQQAASSGTPSDNAAPSNSISPEVFAAYQDQIASYISSSLDKFQTQIGDLYGRTTDLQSGYSDLGNQISSFGGYQGGDYGYPQPAAAPAATTAGTTKTTTSKPAFGGVVKTTVNPKTGVKNTYYANGRIVTQAPGKTAYVSKKGS